MINLTGLAVVAILSFCLTVLCGLWITIIDYKQRMMREEIEALERRTQKHRDEIQRLKESRPVISIDEMAKMPQGEIHKAFTGSFRIPLPSLVFRIKQEKYRSFPKD